MEDKGFDLKVYEFKDQLIQAINESDLPITVKCSVVSDLILELNQLKNQAIHMQKQQYYSKTSKEGE